MMTLAVKIIPGSSRNQIVGWLGDALKIKVQAPPEKGKANAMVCKILAEALDIPVSAIEVIAGHTSQKKTVSINGLENETLMEKLKLF